MSELKLCKDCKFEKRDSWSYIPFIGVLFRRFSKCSHPKFLETNLVTGKTKASHYCEVLRIFHCDCAENAKYFEPK